MKKRIISIILVMLMMIVAFPMNMFAESSSDSVNWASLTKALKGGDQQSVDDVFVVDNSSGKYVVKLLTNLGEGLDGDILVAPSVTLDLNGHNLYADYASIFGEVIDSASSKGKIVIDVDNLSYPNVINETQDIKTRQMPVWNRNDGYSFYEVGANAKWGYVDSENTIMWEKQGDNAAKFKVQPTPGNKADASIIYDQDSNVRVGFKTIFTNSVGEVEINYAFSKGLVDTWANDNPSKNGLFLLWTGIKEFSGIKAKIAMYSEPKEGLRNAVYYGNYISAAPQTPVDPEEPEQGDLTVTFVDYNTNVIDEKQVEYGGTATLPTNPNREGYIFKGWNGQYENVTSNQTVTAEYISADANNIFYLESTSTKKNEDFTINLNVQGTVKISSTDLEIHYDKDVLEAVSANDEETEAVVNIENPGVIYCNFSRSQDRTKKFLLSDLTFKVKNGATVKNTEIYIVMNKCGCFTEDGKINQNAEYNLVKGYISINE